MSNEPVGSAPLPDPYAVPDGPPPAPTGPAPTGPAPTEPFPYGATPYGTPQYGAPQYGAPQYGAPQYGTPQPYGYPAGQTPYGFGAPPTEGMAVASLVTSLVGIFVTGGLISPVGLGLGIAALRRIRVSGKSGRGLAIAGIVAGAVGTVLLLLVIAWFVLVGTLLAGMASNGDFSVGGQTGSGGSSTADPGTGSSDTLPTYTLRTDLSAGTCLDLYSYEYDMSDTSPVDCAVPHEGEVVALVTLPAPVSTDLNADDPVWTAAWDQCDQAIDALDPGYSQAADLVVFTPHPDDFAAGATTAYCTYFTWDDELVTGSVLQHTLQSTTTGTSS